MAVISIPSSIGGVAIPGSVINGPLGALFGNKYSRNDLHYPRNLGSSPRSHVVVFNIMQVDPVGYTGQKNYSLSDAINGVGANISQKSQEAAAAFKSEISGNNPTVVDFAKGIGASISSVTDSLSLTPQKPRTVATVSLYMPDTIQFTYDATYNEINMADVIKDTASSVPIVGKAVASAATSDITKLLLKSQGLAINPNQQLLFDSISLRTYQMAFTFTPYTKQEAATVADIIKTFKKWARPQTVNGAGGMLFVPPALFQPTFNFKNGENKNISKVGKSVITSIDVNYAPNGFSTHTDGAPVQTQLTLQFKEVELVDRGQIEQGY